MSPDLNELTLAVPFVGLVAASLWIGLEWCARALWRWASDKVGTLLFGPINE